MECFSAGEASRSVTAIADILLQSAWRKPPVRRAVVHQHVDLMVGPLAPANMAKPSDHFDMLNQRDLLNASGNFVEELPFQEPFRWPDVPRVGDVALEALAVRSEEHTSELQSRFGIS